MEWQPIETAPKDGSEILLFCPDDEPQVVAGNYYRPAKCWMYADQLMNEVSPDGCQPTHWMPLPEPPK